MRTISVLMVMLAIGLIWGMLFLGCEEDSNPVEAVQSTQMEASEAGKLNAFPILGYMQSGAYIAPEIDGSNDDQIWKNTEPFEIQLTPDETGFAPTVTTRALYDNWYIYLMAEWDDEQVDERPNFWWFGNPDPNGTTDIAVYDTIFTIWVTEDSSFKPPRRPVRRAAGPEVWSRWATPFSAITKTMTYISQVNVSVDGVYTTTWDTVEVSYDTLKFSGGEDGLSIMWNVNVGNFLNCSNLCHGDSRMSTDQNEAADVWSWYAYRTNHRKVTDDLALLTEGFVGDEGDSCYTDNIDRSKTPPIPAWAYLHQPQKDTLVLYDLRSVKFYTSLPWFSGNHIPGYKLNIPSGSRGDVVAVGRHKDGRWTLEIKRLLHTVDIQTSKDNTDVQFNPNADADVSFHLVAYNNALGKKHAYTGSVQTLHFVQLLREQ